MFSSAITRRYALAIGAAALAVGAFSSARSAAFEAVPDLNPELPVQRLAYLTETATSTSKVWVASLSGAEPKLLGPGQQPLLSPDGHSVAVSLFGDTSGPDEHGPSIGIYPAAGGPIVDYLSLETATATPLAWSPDSRYLAVALQSTNVTNIAAGSGIDVIDTQNGAVTQIAAGSVYGASFAPDGSDRLVFALSHSEAFAGAVNLYVSEADGAGLHRITSDGRSLHPLWGAKYIAFDRERSRKLSPEYQIWLESPSGGAPVRRVTHIPVDPLSQGLVPLAFSADGNRLLAEFEGEDNSEAYAVNVVSGHARIVTVHGQSVLGAGISASGNTLLVDQGAFEQPPSHAHVVAVPFAGGGGAKVLVANGSQASWNG
jgi:Tol biopolymer transport system component